MEPRDLAYAEDALAAPSAPGRVLGAPRGVRVRWLGTAGFAIEAEGRVLLVDPYLTRASLARCAFSRLEPDVATITRAVSRADAIVVGHTHFDHVLDVPAIARLTGAKVLGSRSAANLCRADGVPASQVVDVESALRGGTVTIAVEPFELRFFASAHSKLILGRKVPFEGDVGDCDQVPLRAPGYKCGAVFSVEIRVLGRTIFHLGSAELVEAHLPRREVDLLLFCVAGWQQTPRVIERACAWLDPHAVLLSHWDDFFRPLAEPVRALPGVQLPRVVERFAREARGVPVGVVPLLGALGV